MDKRKRSNKKQWLETEESLQYNYIEEIKTMRQLTADNLVKFCKQEKKVGIKGWEYQGDSNLEFREIMLKNKQGLESQYVQNKTYWYNIRRGNTVLERVGENTVIRKGFKKVYELQDHYISYQCNDNDQLDQRVFNRIFKPIEQCLEQGYSIKLIVQQKLNGINVQISYSQQYEGWSISNKDKSIFVRRDSDIQYYDNQKLEVVVDIYNCWKQYLMNLSEQQLVEVKELLNQKTLVGDLIGSNRRQGLVDYGLSEQQILFYGIVDNNCADSYISYQEYQELAKQIKINTNMIKIVDNLNDIENVRFAFKKMCREVKGLGMKEGGEGVLVFVEAEDYIRENSIQLSQLKIKTQDYKIIKLIKQKLKSVCWSNYTISLQEYLQQLDHKIKKYTQYFDAYLDNQEYLNIGQQMYEYMMQLNRNSRLESIHKQFIEFGKNSAINNEQRKINVDYKNVCGEVLLNHIQDNHDSYQKDKKFMIVIVSPVCYFQDSFKQELIKKLTISQVYEQLEEIQNDDDYQIFFVDQVDVESRLITRFKQIYVLVVGYSQKQVDYIYQNIGLFKQQQQNQQQCQDYLQNQLIIINRLKQYLETNMKSKYEVIDDLLPVHQQINKQKGLKYFEISNVIKTIEKAMGLFNNQIENTENIEINIKQDCKKGSRKQSTQNQKKEKQRKNSNKAQQKKKSQNLIIMIPVGIPGMGKTSYIGQVNQKLKNNDNNQIEVSVISSDDIRKKCMDQQKYQNQENNNDALFEQIQSQVTDQFQKAVQEYLLNLKNNTNRNFLLYLDKNYIPQNMKPTVEYLCEQLNNCNQIQYKIVAIVPESQFPLQNKQYNLKYPFSLSFLLTCLERALKRKGNQSLDNNDSMKIIEIVFTFFNFFRNFNTKGFNLMNQGFDYTIRLEYNKEIKEELIDEELRKQVIDILGTSKSMDQQQNYSKLLDLLQTSNTRFESVQQQAVEHLLNQINNTFKMFQ